MHDEPTPNRVELALGGNVLGDDGRPDSQLVCILARHLAATFDRPNLATSADAMVTGQTATERRDARRRILDDPHFLAALVQTPTGPLIESLPSRVY